jgi:hypothetical protein
MQKPRKHRRSRAMPAGDADHRLVMSTIFHYKAFKQRRLTQCVKPITQRCTAIAGMGAPEFHPAL